MRCSAVMRSLATCRWLEGCGCGSCEVSELATDSRLRGKDREGWRGGLAFHGERGHPRGELPQRATAGFPSPLPCSHQASQSTKSSQEDLPQVSLSLSGIGGYLTPIPDKGTRVPVPLLPWWYFGKPSPQNFNPRGMIRAGAVSRMDGVTLCRLHPCAPPEPLFYPTTRRCPSGAEGA